MFCCCVLAAHPAAPITAANLLLNAKSGLYNGAPLSVSGNAVLVDAPAGTRSAAGAAAAGAAQAAEADAEADASAKLALSSSSGSGRQRASPAALPLEILAQGEFEPLYRSPLDVRSGELPVLPLSIYGAGEQQAGVWRGLVGEGWCSAGMLHAVGVEDCQAVAQHMQLGSKGFTWWRSSL